MFSEMSLCLVFGTHQCSWPHLGHPDHYWTCFHLQVSYDGQHQDGCLTTDIQQSHIWWLETPGSGRFFSVFSTVCTSWEGWGPQIGPRSQTGGWRGPSPVCGSSPPWHWCGSSRRCRLRCSTPPTRRLPPEAWWGWREGAGAGVGEVGQEGGSAAGQTSSVKETFVTSGGGSTRTLTVFPPLMRLSHHP